MPWDTKVRREHHQNPERDNGHLFGHILIINDKRPQVTLGAFVLSSLWQQAVPEAWVA